MKLKEYYKNNKLTFYIFLVAILLIITLTLLSIPFINYITNESTRQIFKEKVINLGFLGFLIILLLQIIQIVIAFIPGQAIELLAGMIYGPWLGTLVCVIGVIIATIISYYLTKWLGKPLFSTKKEQKDIKKYNFLTEEKNSTLLFFIIFITPGTPKDVFNYVAPFTNVKFLNYLLIATFARIPGLIGTAYIGDLFMKNQYKPVIIITIVIAVLAVVGILINKIYLDKRKKTK